jgi:hypothetical protein
MLKPKILFPVMIAILILAFLPACAATQNSDSVKMAPMAGMPADVQNAPVTVQQAYQFAIANPEVMKQIPCYCGCGSIGHTSNYSCYVAGVGDNGVITYDNHALGCSLCVDITQDTMRMTKDGKSPSDIKAIVDSTYSKYGTTNIK